MSTSQIARELDGFERKKTECEQRIEEMTRARDLLIGYNNPQNDVNISWYNEEIEKETKELNAIPKHKISFLLKQLSDMILDLCA